MRTLALVLTTISLIAVPATGSAQDASDDERARLHFSAGRSYFEEGDHEEALDEFQRAYDLSQRAPLLVNIANCQERLGLWREAAENLERFVATLDASDAQRPTLQRRIENLRERAARQEPAPASTEPSTSSDPTTRSEPDGTDEPASTGAPTSSAPSGQPASDGLLVPSLIAFGAGGAGLVAFGILGGLALAEESSISSGCGAARACTASQVQAMDDLALGADISLAIGLVGVAAGVILIVIDPPRGATGSEVALAPWGTPDAGGLTARGSF